MQWSKLISRSLEGFVLHTTSRFKEIQELASSYSCPDYVLQFVERGPYDHKCRVYDVYYLWVREPSWNWSSPTDLEIAAGLFFGNIRWI